MPRPKSSKEKKRLSLETSLKLRETMESLLDRTDSDSITEVIKRAIYFYDWHIGQCEKGAQFYVKSRGQKKRHLLYPHLH